jgi:glycosyltransferase involved in cell wall biosynthesis
MADRLSQKQIDKFGKIVLTMPVYNEIEVIEEVVRKNFSYVKGFSNSDLIISEDGSTDGTKELLQKLQKELGFTFHSSPTRKGASRGIKNALKFALKEGGDIVLITDSDNQHEPKDFDLLLKQINRFDMVVGLKKPRRDPYWRRIGSKAWNLFIRLLFGLSLHDVNCGFRAIRKEVLTKVLEQNETFTECPLSEFSIRAEFAGFTQTEVPITHYMRDSKPKAWNPDKIPQMAFGLFFSCLKLRLKLTRVLSQSVKTDEKN